ncbi:hypothetical protein C7974DRAFT_433112 [Boeremia exigua]|uniref:uncharacterized protein n=1 Tax=Boeremia exigua TaxID=749465 RepID=UPI001E8E4519|nr:uncharacterized protein C7974DRAFT_433112 [Boeremia exigua]KAH6632898.1 hypothetical protein C7974DRAFT_433112 [Boeremia exigua]
MYGAQLCRWCMQRPRLPQRRLHRLGLRRRWRWWRRHWTPALARALPARPLEAQLAVEPDDGKDPKSCSTSSRYRTCTTKLIVSKTVFPDADSTATTTSTSSTCYTVTACTGSQSAFTTTTQTTTTVEDLCAPTACGNACGPVKRNMGVIPTAVPQLDDSGVLHIGSMSSNSALAKRAISKRDIPLDDTGDWANYYRTLKADPNTFVIDNYAQTGGTLASWVRYKWGNSPINVIVQDLYGCIAVIAVSQLGVFVGHFWEKNSVIVPDRFLIDVIGTLQSNFDPSSDTSKEYFGPSTRFYIMSGTAKSTVTNGPDDIASLGRSDPAGPFRAQQVESIKRLLSVYSDDIVVYTYLRQRDETIREQGGWGRAAVSFHPAQSTFPGGPLLPGTALVKVVLQGTPLENRFWPYVQIDVWRVNSGGKATNVAKQVAAGQVINPCNDLNQVASTETVTLGSENVGVGRSQPFAILQSNGVVLQGGGNCAFSGGPYAPDRSSGLIAGQFTCDSGTPVLRDCFRPTNNLATTCGRGAASGCGKLGQNCNDYYQLVASCRI